MLVVSHDRYFLNQVADRLDRPRRRQGPGDRGRLRDLSTPRPAGSRGARPGQGGSRRGLRRRRGRRDGRSRRSGSASSPTASRPTWKREIAEVEAKVAELEDLLGQPATWRDPIKARDSQLRHEDLKAELARLYEHWEEALEFNV